MTVIAETFDNNGKKTKDMKEWLFMEQIRITEAREELEREREAFLQEKRDAQLMMEQRQAIDKLQAKRFEEEKELFQKKVKLLQEESRRLGNDRIALDRERKEFEEVKKYRRSAPVNNGGDADVLFKGVNSEASLKKRYRELLKIFHPDNLHGDTYMIQKINELYENLSKKYS